MPNATEIDLGTWARAEQYHFFRTFERPHYAVTARIDVSPLMARKGEVSVFRTCLWAVGMGVHAVPELRMRFEGERVVAYDTVDLSSTLATEGGDYRFGYFPWTPDRARFDATAAAEINAAGAERDDNPGMGRSDMIYMTCLPWLDFTGFDHAMPHRDDCIPRVAWGKIVPKGAGFDMAVTLQVHHALVFGAHVAAFFDACQAAFVSLDTERS